MNRAMDVLHSISEVYFAKLFHATSTTPLLHILRTDSMQGMEGGNHPDEISFSRTPVYWHRFPNKNVRLILDGERLSRDYRLIPYMHPGMGLKNDEGSDFEYELMMRGKLTNLHKYLLGIEMLDGYVAPFEMETLRPFIHVPVYFVDNKRMTRKHYEFIKSL